MTDYEKFENAAAELKAALKTVPPYTWAVATVEWLAVSKLRLVLFTLLCALIIANLHMLGYAYS